MLLERWLPGSLARDIPSSGYIPREYSTAKWSGLDPGFPFYGEFSSSFFVGLPVTVRSSIKSPGPVFTSGVFPEHLGAKSKKIFSGFAQMTFLVLSAAAVVGDRAAGWVYWFGVGGRLQVFIHRRCGFSTWSWNHYEFVGLVSRGCLFTWLQHFWFPQGSTAAFAAGVDVGLHGLGFRERPSAL